MFTGFASENTPAIQVWDFFRAFASITAVRSVSLPDDCAPIQVFRTGATGSSSIRVYLPTSPIEGKQITIVNQHHSSSAQLVEIYSSDRSGDGTGSTLFLIGPSDSVTLVYSKQNISYGSNTGTSQTGWISLDKGSLTAANFCSAVVGGDNNIATTQYAFIGGGNSNTNSGPYSVILGGTNNSISNSYSGILGGIGNAVSSSSAAVVGGSSNIVNSTSSTITGGTQGTTRSIAGNFVTPASINPIINGSGRSQTATLILGRETTNATATRLASNSSAAATTNQVILPNNSAYYFRGSITSGVTGGGASAMWTFEGGIKRGANAASTTLIQSVINTVAADAGASTWVVALSADTTNGGLAVTVTGQAATTIRWVCKIETTEMTF